MFLKWYHITFVARIPNFCLGIFMYQHKENLNAKYFYLSMVMALIMVYMGKTTLVLLLSLLSLFVLTFLLIISKNRLVVFDTFGNYSLEIYVANCFSLLLLQEYIRSGNNVITLLLYFFLNFLLSVLIIKANKFITGLTVSLLKQY